MAEKPRWRMSGLLAPEVEDYIYELLPERDPVLQEMEAYAAEHDVPIVGPAVGRLFNLLARVGGAKTVCELGSAIGYSTLWWARAVGEQGRVIYTDGDRKNADEAKRYFDQAGIASRIDIK